MPSPETQNKGTSPIYNTQQVRVCNCNTFIDSPELWIERRTVASQSSSLTIWAIFYIIYILIKSVVLQVVDKRDSLLYNHTFV